MAVKLGDEFRAAGTPSQELLRRLLYYAGIDSGSVLTGGFERGAGIGSEREPAKRAEIDSAWLQLSEIHQARIAALQDRLDELDQASFIALRDAEERLEEIKKNANRTIDGRLAFEAEDGTIRDEQGNEIGREEVDWSRWNPDADSFETYEDAKHRRAEARQFHEKVKEHKDRLESGDLTNDELADLERETAELEDAMPGGAVAAREQGSDIRTTSAAKDFTDNADQRDGGLRGTFAGALTPADPGTKPNAETPLPRQTSTVFTPD